MLTNDSKDAQAHCDNGQTGDTTTWNLFRPRPESRDTLPCRVKKGQGRAAPSQPHLRMTCLLTADDGLTFFSSWRTGKGSHSGGTGMPMSFNAYLAWFAMRRRRRCAEAGMSSMKEPVVLMRPSSRARTLRSRRILAAPLSKWSGGEEGGGFGWPSGRFGPTLHLPPFMCAGGRVGVRGAGSGGLAGFGPPLPPFKSSDSSSELSLLDHPPQAEAVAAEGRGRGC